MKLDIDDVTSHIKMFLVTLPLFLNSQNGGHALHQQGGRPGKWMSTGLAVVILLAITGYNS